MPAQQLLQLLRLALPQHGFESGREQHEYGVQAHSRRDVHRPGRYKRLVLSKLRREQHDRDGAGVVIAARSDQAADRARAGKQMYVGMNIAIDY